MAEIGFIGMGNMGSAILNGLLKVYSPENMIFSSARREKMGSDSQDKGKSR